MWTHTQSMYITPCWYALTGMYNQHKYSPLYAIILLLVTKAIAPGLVEVFSRLQMHAKTLFIQNVLFKAMAPALHNIYAMV